MIFFIRYEGKEHTVRVETRQGQYIVQFEDGPEENADLVYFGNDCTFLRDTQVFSANVVGDKENYTVWRPEGNLQFHIESEYKRIVNMLRGQHLENESHIYAKMPGKVVKLLVKTGDTVEIGQTVAVIEAMKMENEIRATIDGRVSNVAVSEGQAVETGALLLELEPLH